MGVLLKHYSFRVVSRIIEIFYNFLKKRLCPVDLFFFILFYSLCSPRAYVCCIIQLTPYLWWLKCVFLTFNLSCHSVSTPAKQNLICYLFIYFLIVSGE